MKQEIIKISKQSKLSSFNRARKTNKERILKRLSKRESGLWSSYGGWGRRVRSEEVGKKWGCRELCK